MPETGGQANAAAAVKDPAGAGSAAVAVRNQLGAWAKTAVPAVASLIGLAGFVAIVGAAITWVRFQAAHLPADQAVAEIPQHELVATGVSAVVLFSLVGIAAVVLVRFADPFGNASRGTRYGLIALVAVELIAMAALVHNDSAATFEVGALALVGAVLYGLVIHFSRPTPGDAAGRIMRELETRRRDLATVERQRELMLKLIADRKQTFDAAETALGKARELAKEPPDMAAAMAELADAQQRLVDEQKRLHHLEDRLSALDIRALELEANVAQAEGWLGAAKHAPPGGEVHIAGLDLGGGVPGWMSAFLRVGIVLAGGAIVGAIDSSLLAPLAAAGALAYVALGVAAATTETKFFWCGVAVFLSALALGAIFEVIRTFNTPKVQPVAFMHKEGKNGSKRRPVYGIYVGRTSKHLFYAELHFRCRTDKKAQTHSGSLISVRLNQVSNMAIGTLQPPELALRQAPGMAKDLAPPNATLLDAQSNNACH